MTERLQALGVVLALSFGAAFCASSRAPSATVLPSAKPSVGTTSSALDVSPRARQVHTNAIVVDTHIDTTQRMLFDKAFDLDARHTDGHVDIPRMRDGGLDAVFFSIWVPSSITGAAAARRALDLIDRTREAVRTHPRDLLLATTAADIRRAAAEHKIAALMGMEGGHIIDNDLGLLRDYAALGVRYLTLTHAQNTEWADSATDTPAHEGLTPFGREVIAELNRLGVLVDVSHVSDKTFYDALAASRAPIIASHSSCRALVNHARNMTDDMLRALAKNGGVVMINYVVTFLDEAYRLAAVSPSADVAARLREVDQRCGADEACSLMGTERVNRALMASGQIPPVRWEAIVDHIDHAVKVAGIDHVGLGSDFDGATTPIGMEDVTKLPRITEALLGRGYSEADVAKILGGNILRVMEAVEGASRTLREK